MRHTAISLLAWQEHAIRIVAQRFQRAQHNDNVQSGRTFTIDKALQLASQPNHQQVQAYCYDHAERCVPPSPGQERQ